MLHVLAFEFYLKNWSRQVKSFLGLHAHAVDTQTVAENGIFKAHEYLKIALLMLC